MLKTNRFFLILFPLLVLTAIAILDLSLRTFNLSEKAEGCGCNLEEATGNFEPGEKTAFFLNEPISPPATALAERERPVVLGETSPEEKWIEIDLSDQKITAWQGEAKFLESSISSGKWGKTPTGEFNIWGKFKYTKMSGGNKEDHTYYYLPNVPYTMYFYKGFGLHGTYWHNNFGHPMSHGCVNLPTLVAEKIFYWTTPVLPSDRNSVMASKEDTGTKVIIHE